MHQKENPKRRTGLSFQRQQLGSLMAQEPEFNLPIQKRTCVNCMINEAYLYLDICEACVYLMSKE